MNDYGTFLCTTGINNEPIDLCGNIDDTTLYTWGGHLPIKGVYKEYFLSLVNVSMIPGVEVSEGSDENAAVVFFDDPLKN